MNDVTATFTATVTAINHAVTIAKALKEANAALENATVKHQFAELYTSLSEVKMSMADLRGELQDKDQKIKDLTEQLNTKNNIIFKNNMYYIANGTQEDGPFCTKCYDVKRLTVRLYETTPEEFQCRECNSWYSSRPAEHVQMTVSSDYDAYTDY